MSRTVARALALALLLPCSASAQILGARVTAAGGTEGLLDGSSNIPAYIGQLGLEWRQPGSRGAFRLQLSHYQLNRRFSAANFPGCTSQCAQWDRFGLTGFTFDGTFDLGRGRVRPYLLSGLGIYRAATTTGSNYQCSFGGAFPDSCTYGEANERRLIQWTGGLHSGIGLATNIGKASLFTEFRMMMLPTDGRNSRLMFPLTLGVKF